MEEFVEDHQLDSGAFALIDCLGFKGIWRDQAAPSSILSNLIALKNDSASIIQSTLPERWGRDGVDVSLAFVSDTVALSVRIPRGRPQTAIALGLCVEAAGALVRELVRRFLDVHPALLLRGCITVGKFTSEDAFFLGPAVDEVAELMNLAEGALVWLTPRASKLYDEFLVVLTQELRKAAADVDEDPMTLLGLHEAGGGSVPPAFQAFKRNPELASQLLRQVLEEVGPHEGPFVPSCSVPLKGGNRLRTYVVNPLSGLPSEKSTALAERILKLMDKPELAVAIKRQNTQKFLDFATEHNLEQERKIDQAYKNALEGTGASEGPAKEL